MACDATGFREQWPNRAVEKGEVMSERFWIVLVVCITLTVVAQIVADAIKKGK